MNNANIFIKQANKLETSSNIFELIFPNNKIERQQNIAELYEKAGNILKFSDKEKAIKCYIKVLMYLNDELEKKNILLNIASLYSSIDYMKSIEYYNKLVIYYVDKGDTYNIIKYLEIIADLYFKNNHINNAKNIYEEILKLTNDNTKNKPVKIYEKLCELLIQSNDLLKAGNLYFDLVDYYINNNKTTYIYNARNYIFLGLLCYLAVNDNVKALNNYEKYKNLDFTFIGTYEENFFIKLYDAINKNNIADFENVCEDYDKTKPLTPLLVHLLLKIKNNIINNVDDEINLC